MRLLNPDGWGLLVVALALALTATQSIAHPTGPDHGLNESVYAPLWSGDEDATNTSELAEGNDSAVSMLADGTDVPLDSPPEAVERWNRFDHLDFPSTNATKSIHPPDASLRGGEFIKDAYVELFAVTPSTRAHLSPSNQPLYVAPDGRVRGTVDYRIATPANDTSGIWRAYWSVVDHNTTTRLTINDRTVATTNDTHTPRLSYTDLGGRFGLRQNISLNTTVSVTFRKRVEFCTERNGTGSCADWYSFITYPIETVTVVDSIRVVSYTLAIGGFKAEYPNGDLGLVVYKSRPWLGYSLPGGDVRGVWRFYSARDEDWDTLVHATADGDRETHSPLHPLQTHAYPIETGPTPSPRATVSILETYGVQTRPPTLPSDVNLDVLAEPYTASYGIATRVETTTHDLSEVQAQGLVRGVTASAEDGLFVSVPINRSNLTLAVVNRTDDTVTVSIRLVDANTGAPIETAGRGGFVSLGGTVVETDANGTVRKTLSRPPSGISARYEPGAWWLNHPGYTGDSDVVYARGTVLEALRTLYELLVPVSLFLGGVFLIDRITGWRVWPPWRWL